ncbi:MAG: aldehyde dehydrogenase family protein, partial [Candidatus Paceibacteria bacterium]
MSFQSINPATGEKGKVYEEHGPEAIEKRLQRAASTFESWRNTSFSKRAKLMHKAADLFIERARALAVIASEEMGKPIVAGIAEAEKCAWALNYYADNAESFLALENIETDFEKSYVRFEPIGVVLAVMPWNFPYWQVARFAAPVLMAGNVGLLKHASNVQGAAIAFEAIFLEAGFPEGAFQNLAIKSGAVSSRVPSKSKNT